MEKAKSVLKKILYWGIAIFLFFLAWPFISSLMGLDGWTSTMFKRLAHATDQYSRFNEIKSQEGSRAVSASTRLLELANINSGEAHNYKVICDLGKGEEVVLLSDEPTVEFAGRTYVMVQLPGKVIDGGVITDAVGGVGWNVKGYVDARFVSAFDDTHSLLPSTQILRPRCEPYVFQLGAGDASDWITFPKDQLVNYTAWDKDRSYNYYFESKNGDNIGSGRSEICFKRGEKFRIRAKTATIVYISVN